MSTDEDNLFRNLACTCAARDMGRKGFCPVACDSYTTGQYIGRNYFFRDFTFLKMIKENPDAKDYSFLKTHYQFGTFIYHGKAENAREQDNPLYCQYENAMERQNKPFKPKKTNVKSKVRKQKMANGFKTLLSVVGIPISLILFIAGWSTIFGDTNEGIQALGALMAAAGCFIFVPSLLILTDKMNNE